MKGKFNVYNMFYKSRVELVCRDAQSLHARMLIVLTYMYFLLYM